MAKPKLSLLVPLHNAARWVQRFCDCLPTAFGDVSDYEIVFADDGSTDNTIESLIQVLRESVFEKRCRILRNEKNLGVSETRQKLLDNATGDFFIYADPDDIIAPNMYESMYHRASATGADFVWEDIARQNGASFDRISQKMGESSSEVLKGILGGKLHGSVCQKLFSRAFLLSARCRPAFPSGEITLCEDLYFVCMYLKEMPKVAYNNECHYRYSYIPGSSTQRQSLKNSLSLIRVGNDLAKAFKGTEYEAALMHFLRCAKFSVCFSNAVDDALWRGCFPDVCDLKGEPVGRLLKLIYQLAVRGHRGLAMRLYALLIALARIKKNVH